MKPYRFSPVKSQAELLRAVEYLHRVCHEQCKRSFGRYLPVRGSVAVFAHDDTEFAYLAKLRQQLTSETNYDDKYFELREPIDVPERGDMPGARYEFLYIHRPEPERLPQVGDIDFVLPIDEHEALKRTLTTETFVNGMRLFHRLDKNMIELQTSDTDVIVYAATNSLREAIDAQKGDQ